MSGIATIIALGTALSGSALSVGAPTTDLISSSWQLDFNFHDPQRISVLVPGEVKVSTFWYMLYTVTNNTGREVQFFPSFRLVTDTLDVVEGGDSISPSVYDAIAERHRKFYPFFALPSAVIGPVLQGTENSRTSAVVFHQFDRNASGFTIYVSGLSGDVERIRNPGFVPSAGESEDNPRVLLFRRTLAITYDLPGDPTTQSLAVPIRRNREWVMR